MHIVIKSLKEYHKKLGLHIDMCKSGNIPPPLARSSDADRCCQQMPNAEESAEESEARAGLPPTDPGVGSEAVLLATLLSG